MTVEHSPSQLHERIRAALAVINGGNYQLPWQVVRRSYDHEDVIAARNIVVGGGLACAGNTELRRAVVEVINAAAELMQHTSAMRETP